MGLETGMMGVPFMGISVVFRLSDGQLSISASVCFLIDNFCFNAQYNNRFTIEEGSLSPFSKSWMEIAADGPLMSPDEHRKYRNLAAESEVTLLFYSKLHPEGGFPVKIR
jgi:hypothetical protein